jgi:hypothetical protein
LPIFFRTAGAAGVVVPHVELRLLPAGHFWPREAPAETSAVLREVLAVG